MRPLITGSIVCALIGALYVLYYTYNKKKIKFVEFLLLYGRFFILEKSK